MTQYALRKAGVLDIPFLFELIQRCALDGSFSAHLMSAKGYALVLRMLLLNTLRLANLAHSDVGKEQILVFIRNDQEVGFLHYAKTQKTACTILLCAIAPAQRNQKLGTQMLRMFIASLPPHTQLTVHCNKYSRAMQHILTRLKFTRDKNCLRIVHEGCATYLETFYLSKCVETHPDYAHFPVEKTNRPPGWGKSVSPN